MSLNYNISASHPAGLGRNAPQSYSLPESEIPDKCLCWRCEGEGGWLYEVVCYSWSGPMPSEDWHECPECGGTGLTLLGMIMMSKIQIPLENLRWQKFSPT